MCPKRKYLIYISEQKNIETTGSAGKQIGQIPGINFPGASTQTPQGRLPPATQEWGIYPTSLCPILVCTMQTSGN